MTAELDRLYIPSYRRTEEIKQKTWRELPQKWKDKTFFVLDRQDADHPFFADKPVLLCPWQGKGPEGSDPKNYGLPATREWIAHHAVGLKYGVLDDDVDNFVKTKHPDQPLGGEFPHYNTRIKSEEDFDEFFSWTARWMDEGFVHCGYDVCWNPPHHLDTTDNFRMTVVHFYDGRKLPVDKIDFKSIKFGQDYHITLQLLRMGYPNRVHLRRRIRPAVTQYPGGCAEQRTIEHHNACMRLIQEAHPEFVQLNTKIAKLGAWGGQEKLALHIYWKKAYESSKRTSLESYFQ